MSILGCVFLLTWVVYCASESPDETLASLPTVSKESSSPPPLVCSPFLKHSDSRNYNYTLSLYMESEDPVFVECHSSVSSELKNIFRDTPESAKLREELRGSLGNVCALYVEMFSIVARMRKKGETLQMCDDNALVNATVKSREFCEVKPESELVVSTLTTLDAFGFTNYSSALSLLFGQGAECPSKCGGGNGKILCNAYYSMATILSSVVLQARLNEVDDATTLATTPPVTAPPTSKEDPLPIDQLLDPMWSLPQSTLLKLIAGDTGYRRKTLTDLLIHFPTEDLKRFLARPDLVTSMRMFWVVRLVYDRFSAMNERELEFSTHNDNLYYKGELEHEDEVMVKNFDDVDTILEYIYAHRTLLFAQGRHTTEPVVVPPTKAVNDPLVPSPLENLNSAGNGGSEKQGGSDKTPERDQNLDLERLAELVNRPDFQRVFDIMMSRDPAADESDITAAEELEDMFRAIFGLGEGDDLLEILQTPLVKEVLSRKVTTKPLVPIKKPAVNDKDGTENGKDGAGEDEGREVDEGLDLMANADHDKDGAGEDAGREVDEGLDLMAIADGAGGDIIYEQYSWRGWSNRKPTTDDSNWMGRSTYDYWNDDRKWDYFSSSMVYQYRNTAHGMSAGLKAVFIALLVLGSLFVLFLASVCVMLLACCCVHSWSKIRDVTGCNKPKSVKYYRLSTTEDI